MKFKKCAQLGLLVFVSGFFLSCGEKSDSEATTDDSSKAGATAPDDESVVKQAGGMKPRMVKGYFEALPVPGKKNFVFNPYTENLVDVRGIPSGTLVRDPEDSDPKHVFRIP